MKKFTPEETADIIDLFNKERNILKIAKLYGHTQKVIKRVLTQNGIDSNFNRRCCSIEDNQRIINEYNKTQGSARSISITLNLPLNRVRKVLLGAGVKLTNRKFSDEFEDKIVQMYVVEKKSCIVIEKITGVCFQTILGIIKRKGFPIRLLNKIDPLHEQDIVVNYINNPRKSAAKLGREYGVKDHVIRKILNKHNISTELRPDKQHFNEHSFKELYRPEICWHLGWMWSDGCVASTGTAFQITVHRDDAAIFNQFGEILRAESYSHLKSSTSNCDVFQLCSEICQNDLMKVGCAPKKSLIIRWPKYNFNQGCLCAFLRGLYEGDGSFSTKVKTCASLSLASGSSLFLDDVSNILAENLRVSAGLRFKNEGYIRKDGSIGTSFKLQHGKFYETYKLLCYFYDNGNCKYYLDRKYQEFLKIKKHFETSFYRSQKFLIRNNNTGQLHYAWGHMDVMTLFNNEFTWHQVDTWVKNFDTYYQNRKKCGLTRSAIPENWELIKEPEKQEILQKLGSFRDILVE